MTTTVQNARTGLAANRSILGHGGPGWAAVSDAAMTNAASRPCPDDGMLAEYLRNLTESAADLAHGGLDLAGVLWSRCMKFDAADPGWPDRDRFLLSPSHGHDLLQALQHLTGFASIGEASAAEAAMQARGFGAAVGMAIAERFLAARFGRTLVDHRTWLLASDADLMDGGAHEAASVAGKLLLHRLCVLWEPAGAGEETRRRFAAYGWATRTVAAGDYPAIAAAIGAAVRSRKPMLIACLPSGAPPTVPPRPVAATEAAVLARWRLVGQRGAAARRSWLKRLAHHPRRTEFERATAGLLPETLGRALRSIKALLAEAGSMTPREASERVLAALVAALPDLVGASSESIAGTPAGFSSRLLHFGGREQGMAAALVGMAAHGGVLPYAAGGSAMCEAIRPALRLAAAMRQRLVHVLTHPVAPAARHQVEHLAGLRAVPNLLVLRPADAVETAECWELALRRDDGPSLLLLDSVPGPSLRIQCDDKRGDDKRGDDKRGDDNRCASGGYVLADAEGPRRATLIATGAEVALALAARARLAAERIAVAVVSLPCWDLFARAGSEHRARVLGEAMRFGIEAGSGFGWERWLGPDGVFIGCDDFAAASALTPESVAATVRRHLAA